MIEEPIDTSVDSSVDSSVCGSERELFDSDGNYVRTICQASYSRSHDTACVDKGMRLFVIDSSEAQKELLSFATSVFGSGGGSTLWVNGKKENDGQWYIYNPDKEPLMSGIKGITDSIDENIISKVVKKRSVEEYGENEDDDFTAEDYNYGAYYNFYNRQPTISETCLALTASGPFKVSTWSCDSKMYSFCEYRKSGYVAKPALTTTTSETITESPEEIDDIANFVFSGIRFG